MIKLLASVAFAALTVLSGVVECVLADPGVGNGGIGRTPATYTNLQGAGTTVIKNSPGTFLGLSNINSAAQITAVTCYDNASAASGPVIISMIAGLTPPQYPQGGIAFVNGLTCNIPLSLLGAGVAVYYR